ncbi:asparagine synthase [Oleiphilus messinensis]|uniref:asparagine synthase (glutamine-hydrolyzing) n=1 Tax=Oleiphilus messinensis TaxID=141451 RepID=A0A1Y0II23_9GAMM|nr:asparagine synthase (glutamine-hydrolyzing) [Oleiphilus messinensis]ARU59506.1 asparagine synthase [Oleiphilus messinensis]
MCGIVGVLGPGASKYTKHVRDMAQLIVHRGPDAEGFWSSPTSNAVLGFRRLAIIDRTSKANQPMHGFKAPHITIVFNGEIYNHRRLRQRLIAEGRQFRTNHSDTEVILEGYQHWGIDTLLNELNGMFAFVIVDRQKQKAYLARDRLGLKPLYYNVSAPYLAFSSEIKAFNSWPQHTAKVNLNAFCDYLSFRSVMAPNTMFEKIKKLEPGGLIQFELNTGQFQGSRWWDPLSHAATQPKSFQAAVDQFAEYQYDALTLQLGSDTPVGLFLSGGVDSALLLKTASDQHQKLSTFTAHYPEHSNYNEHLQAQNLASDFGTKHYQTPISREDYLRAQLAVCYHQDEPIAAPICTSIYYLCKTAKQAGVPVLLSGEGSDEAYFGYQNWLTIRKALAFQYHFPKLTRILAGCISPFLRSHYPYSPFPEFANRAKQNELLFWSGAIDFPEFCKNKLFGPVVLNELQHSDTFERVIKPLRADFEQYRSPSDYSSWMSYTDIRFRLPELMLMRLDKMGMAFSVEARAPLIDHRMVELAMSLPESWMQHRGTKPLIKETAGRHLDHRIVHQQKRGFAAPVREWREDFSTLLSTLTIFAKRTGLLNPEAVAKIINSPGNRLYFNLVNFMYWYIIFIENVLPEHFSDEMISGAVSFSSGLNLEIA